MTTMARGNQSKTAQNPFRHDKPVQVSTEGYRTGLRRHNR
jgi:hypothetical protein